ncbi:hypothetical protein GQ44DRAFT_664553 [Phaeosphaeriaceae sp. PMI808]|nr:hypothetical protein GQ44DRAFT_664553 [Phaeosphaeriaceae sp. PMI808]
MPPPPFFLPQCINIMLFSHFSLVKNLLVFNIHKLTLTHSLLPLHLILSSVKAYLFIYIMSQQGTSSNVAYPSQQSSADTITLCSYHASIISTTPNTQAKGINPMDRFLAEGPAEQSALFVRPDNGKLSTSRMCTCKKTDGLKP